MSLRRKITAATIFVVVLSILASVGVGYYATQARLGDFVDQIGDDEAVQLARSLSREYTNSGGWGTADRALSEAGYSSDGEREPEGHGEGEGESSERFHNEQVRVVITGLDGLVVKDNMSDLPLGADAPELEGRRETVLDLASDQPVGYVYVDVNRQFLSTESHGFLNTLLYITLVGGALTAGLVILLGAWFSKRITAPVKALTDATQAIARGDTASLPVTSSDELGRMSAAFNRMTDALKTQRELRKKLINDVSHELNTPLSVILLEAKGLRDGLQAPEDASDHIIEEVDRLRGMVTDLDWLAETDRGDLRLSLEASSIHELLTAEAGRWQPQSQASGVELSLQLSGDLPDMQLDRMRMSQALGNLVGNAIHATEGGGNIVIRAEIEGGDTAALSVADDGAGIDAADIPHVFDRFYRTDQSRNRGVGGTGLGLAITQAIVEAHGGAITVESEGLGRGATVTVRLPLDRQASSS